MPKNTLSSEDLAYDEAVVRLALLMRSYDKKEGLHPNALEVYLAAADDALQDAARIRLERTTT